MNGVRRIKSINGTGEQAAKPLVRAYTANDLPALRDIWNGVVEEGKAFPQMETLDEAGAARFFAGQDYTGVAERGGEVVGLYILHPNNVGRCGHIANTSYAVAPSAQGGGVGRALVEDSVAQAAKLGYRILQFNAVVASNRGAIHLYKSLGFTQLGVIPGGFYLDDGTYEDILPFYIELV